MVWRALSRTAPYSADPELRPETGTTYSTGQAALLKRSSWMHEVLVEVSGEATQDNYNQSVASGY